MGIIDDIEDAADEAVDKAQNVAEDVAEATGTENAVDQAEDAIQESTGIDLGGSGGGSNAEDVENQGSSDSGVSDTDGGTSGNTADPTSSFNDSSSGQNDTEEDSGGEEFEEDSGGDDFDSDSGGSDGGGSTDITTNNLDKKVASADPDKVVDAAKKADKSILQTPKQEKRTDRLKKSAKQEKQIKENLQELENTSKAADIKLNGKTVSKEKAINELEERRQEVNVFQKKISQGPRRETPAAFERRLDKAENLSNTELAGALLKEGTVDQVAEAGESFLEQGIGNTPGIKQETTQKEINKDISSLGLGVETKTGKANPQKAFNQQLPFLAEAQERAGKAVTKAEKQTPDPVENVGVRTLKRSNTGIQIATEISPTADRLVEETIRGAPGALAKEIPEKAVEPGSLASATAEVARNPVEQAQLAVTGAKSLADSISKNPARFAGKEIGADVALDLATGGGAVISTKGAGKISGKASNLKQTAKKEISEFPKSRKGTLAVPDSRKRPGPASDFRPESEPGDFLTIEPEKTSQDTKIDVSSRTNTGLRDIIESDVDPNTILAGKSVDTGVEELQITEDGLSSPSSVVSRSSPLSEPVSEPLTSAISSSEAISEPVSEPISQPIALSTVQSVVQPEVVPESLVQSQQQVVSLESKPSSKEDNKEDNLIFGSDGEKLSTTESVAADLLGLEESQSDLSERNPLSLRVS